MALSEIVRMSMRARGLKISQKSDKALEVVQVGQASRPTCPGSSPSNGLIHATRQFHELLEHARTKSNHGDLSFSLVVFDVDGVRPHHLLTGELEQVLICRLRTVDNAGWLDDKRLGILLPGMSENDAYRLVHDICAALSKEAVFPRGQVYSFPSDLSIENRNRLDEVLGKPASAPGYTGRFDEALAYSSNREFGAESFCRLRRASLPVWKRSMDIGGALIGLVVLSPVMLVVTVLIRIVSPGPALFRQERIGMKRKPFTMFKFRTMKLDTDTSIHERYVTELIGSAQPGDAMSQRPMTKLDNHPDMILLGKILRKTYIDEIPQLVNVLRGEMSLIGPRPPLAYELQQYPKWCLARFSVPPGMTGLWQVSGKNRLSFNEMVNLDIRYARRMSLWLDLLILLKTPIAIAMEIVNAIVRLAYTRIYQVVGDKQT
jgi:lipopolysaccharide/colanic/teichoic acid biosynthesis glycosyltransferase